MRYNDFGELQLAHVELLTPVLDKSVEFFTKLLGMSVVHRNNNSVYLRAYEDVVLYSLILTQNETSGLGSSAFCYDTNENLERAVKRIEDLGQSGEWTEDNFGHGRSYKFEDKDGHPIKIFSKVDRFKAPDEISSFLPNRPQRKPMRGVPVRRLDHINYMTNLNVVGDNIEFFNKGLGFKLNEFIKDDDGNYFAAWMSVSNLVHEIAMLGDTLGGSGRLHHVAFWYGIPQHLNDIADLCSDYNIPMEIGPIKHGLSQALCMYIIEPGGNRIELFGDSGYLIFDPAWEAIEWKVSEIPVALNWYGGRDYEAPPTYLTYGTPPIKSEIEAYNTFVDLQENRLFEESFISEIPYSVKNIIE